MSHPQYKNWAERQIHKDHIPSIYDWQNMTLAEMAERALAICAAVEDREDMVYGIYAFQCLEAMAKQLKEKYPPRYKRW